MMSVASHLLYVTMTTVNVLFICLSLDNVRVVLPTPDYPQHAMLANGYCNNRKHVAMATKPRAVKFPITSVSTLLIICKTVGRDVSQFPGHTCVHLTCHLTPSQ